MRPLTQGLTVVALVTVVVVGWVILRPGGPSPDDPESARTDTPAPPAEDPAADSGSAAGDREGAARSSRPGDGHVPPGPLARPNGRRFGADSLANRDAGPAATRALPPPLIPPDPVREEKVLWSLRRAIAQAADAGTAAESPHLRRLRAMERSVANRIERRRLDAGASGSAAATATPGAGPPSRPTP